MCCKSKTSKDLKVGKLIKKDIEIQTLLRTKKEGLHTEQKANMGGLNRGLHDTAANPSGLSQNQQKIYDLLTQEYLTPLQIAQRLKKTHQAVYKAIAKLRQKGLLKIGYQSRGVAYHQWGDAWGGLQVTDTEQLQNTFQNHEKRIRLHAQEFNCKLLWSSPQYERLLRDKDIIVIDGNTIRLFKHSIEIYSAPSRAFMGSDVYEATGESLQYWLSLFNQVESRLNVILVKGGNTKIRQVNAHYAHVDDPLAEECNQKKKKVRIYDEEDGKLKFLIDNSWHLNEAECLHPEKGEQDMAVFERKIRDFLDPNAPTATDLMMPLAQYAKNISSHIQAIKDLGANSNNLTKAVEELVTVVKELKEAKK